MLIRVIGGLIVATSLIDAAVTAHELMKVSAPTAAVRFAAALMPLDEANDLRAAEADPVDNEADLRAALEKNPWNTRSWIGLSVHAEMRGDVSGAEGFLRSAAAHDIGRQPRWALANFYYRQGDQQHFLEWANDYRSVTHDQEEGLFRMVAEVVPDAGSFASALPHLGCDELPLAIQAVKMRSLAPDPLVDTMTSVCADTSSRKTLMQLVTELLMQDDVIRASEVWHNMGQRVTLSNADFKDPVTGEGFDWRINQSPSVRVRQQPQTGLQFDLEEGSSSGTVLLFQPVLLTPGARYRLDMISESNPPAVETFRWELVELSTGRHLDTQLDEENINEQPAWEFRAPAVTPKTLALALFYRRPIGATSFHGRFILHGVRLARELTTSAPAKTLNRATIH